MTNFSIKYLQEADSTNDYMKKLMINDELEEGTVILADYQKSGRGQGKNNWHSGRGNNLTFSLLLCPATHADNFFYLTEIISLAVTDFLFSYNIRASIKWPNDIYVDDSKIAGILIENSIADNEIVNCIAGIGININEIDFPFDLPNPTSMRMQKQKAFDINILLEQFLDNMNHRYRQFIAGDLKSLHEEYNLQIYRKGLISRYKSEKGLFNASLNEIMPTGEMMLNKENNIEKGYLFGEIEMII